MKLQLSEVRAYNGCLKPGCSTTRVYRHHRGGEHTFVRHFDWMRYNQHLKKRYAQFVARYQAFLPEDTVQICGNHHEEVHDRLEQHDLDWMVEHDCIKAFRMFTWEEAERLMESRKALTDSWLKLKTPGLKRRRFTNRP